MARFDKLPSEILLSIAQHVGGDFMYSNINCLLLFKRWFVPCLW